MKWNQFLCAHKKECKFLTKKNADQQYDFDNFKAIYGWRIFNHSSFFLRNLHSSSVYEKSMTHGFKRCLCSVCMICVKLQFNLKLCYYMVSNVCACLHRLNRKYRLLRSIAIIEAKQNDISLTPYVSVFVGMYIFCLASGESWFFCGDLTVSYTLLLFTSRYKISQVSRIFLLYLLHSVIFL